MSTPQFIYNADAPSWEELASAKRPKSYVFFCTSNKCCTKPIQSFRVDKSGQRVAYTYRRLEVKVQKFRSLSTAVNTVCVDCGSELFSKADYNNGLGDNDDAGC